MAKPNWIDAKTIAAELGISSMKVRELARKEGAPHRRDGKRVYFDQHEFPEWYKKYKATPRRKSQKAVDVVSIDFTKLPQDQNYVMWNRGEWRGWAVAYPKKVSKQFVELLVDYSNKTLFWLASTFREDIARGRIFIVDPIAVLELITVQLARHRQDAPKEAIGHLQNAIKALSEWRETINNSEEATDEN